MNVLAAVLALVVIAACSPEADRVRDGGAGADPGNKTVVESPPADPHTRDTTLWPGRAPAPVERLARGQMPPPTGLAPIRPEQRTFENGTSGDARREPPPPPARSRAPE